MGDPYPNNIRNKRHRNEILTEDGVRIDKAIKSEGLPSFQGHWFHKILQKFMQIAYTCHPHTCLVNKVGLCSRGVGVKSEKAGGIELPKFEAKKGDSGKILLRRPCVNSFQSLKRMENGGSSQVREFVPSKGGTG